ncbi:MAG: DUF4169 family protein [Pseudomonadota bacterium]
MTTPINLNQARKAKAKAEAKTAAVENRVKFGRTKAEKSLADAQRDKAARALDASKRED